MENKLAKSALIVDIIGTLLVFSHQLVNIEYLFNFENFITALKVFTTVYYLGQFILFIGLVMGLVSLKSNPKHLSYISIAIPIIVSIIVYFLIQSAFNAMESTLDTFSF